MFGRRTPQRGTAKGAEGAEGAGATPAAETREDGQAPSVRRTRAGATAMTGPAAAPPAAPTPATTPSSTTPSTSGGEAGSGKGRPTPKRRDAERGRRQRVQAPRDRKEAARQARTRAREQRAEARAGLLKGDPRHLPLRDQGPVRAFVRDFVDARRSAAEYFLYLAFAVVLLSFVPVPVINAVATYFWLVFFVLVLVDSTRLVTGLRRELSSRFPGESTRGTTLYALLRSTQIRRLRLPPPRLRPGDRV